MILLAGGMGTRMKEAVPKQHMLLYGKPMIIHVLEKVDSIEEIDRIIVTCPSSYIDKTREIVEKYNIRKQLLMIEGGETRQESVYNALQHVQSERVIIHEAARPFVLRREFQALISLPEENATYAIDIPFTVLKGKQVIEQNLNRSELLNIQLPQKFHAMKLLEAHRSARRDGKEFTEDASLLFEYTKEAIKVIPGTEYNLKITKPVDLKLGEIIYRDYIIGEE